MKPQTSAWVDRAEGDFQVASREFEVSPPVNEAVCFHAQQCVEKYLKAVLQEAERSFPRTHDLAFLANLGADLWPEVLAHEPALKALTVYAVATRYPGDIVGHDEAEEAVETMRLIRALLRRALALPGDSGP